MTGRIGQTPTFAPPFPQDVRWGIQLRGALRRRAVFDVSQSGLNVEGKRREKPSAPVNAKGLKTEREVSCKDLTPLVSGLRGWFWPRESVLTA